MKAVTVYCGSSTALDEAYEAAVHAAVDAAFEFLGQLGVEVHQLGTAGLVPIDNQFGHLADRAFAILAAQHLPYQRQRAARLGSKADQSPMTRYPRYADYRPSWTPSWPNFGVVIEAEDET